MDNILQEYRAEMQKELEAILSFWMNNTVDEAQGGFIGQVDFKNKKIPGAPKGAVLNARILWSFSAAYNLTRKTIYLAFANRAFHYICAYFIDKTYGGVYWSVDHNGKPLDTKKQVYALAFTIYGLSEYYKASKEKAALTEAIGLYNAINEFSYDRRYGGYTEAFTRQWETMDNLRLSDKDANEKKSMNTHLHVLEAFTALYAIWPQQQLKEKISELAGHFFDHIIDPRTHHQHLFFNEKWQAKSTTVSYGHDIETAWLLQEAAEAIEDAELIAKTRLVAVNMADAVKKGLDNDGGLWYEYEPAKDDLVKEKHMWPQAEAMVGYFNAWQNTADESYLAISFNSWNFVQQHIHDKQNGEWYWGVKEDYAPMQEDKVGIWKCPYHNSRACIEIIKRINNLQTDI